MEVEAVKIAQGGLSVQVGEHAAVATMVDRVSTEQAPEKRVALKHEAVAHRLWREVGVADSRKGHDAVAERMQREVGSPQASPCWNP